MKWKVPPVRHYFETVVMAYTGDDCLMWPFAMPGSGYAQLRDGTRQRLVGVQICERIYGPKPTPKHEVRHSCGKGKQGCVTPSHVSWGTHAENMSDKKRHGTTIRGERNPKAKLTALQVQEIRSSTEATVPTAKRYVVDRTTIRRIRRNESWA